ncbi:MAG TPA: EI24 domain-containing protein [Vicinamibacteria bacterium]|nr:EI24 domain-containing protein [Vicinamibacteria bacterium]
MTEPPLPRRPSLPVRAAAGAWHVPAGFGFLLRRPGLWLFAVLPVVIAIVLVFAGLVLAVFVGARVEARFAPAPGSLPVWLELPVSLLLWTTILGSGVFLGLGVALALTSPALDVLSSQVEARFRGRTVTSGRGSGWEALQALRGSLYFVAAAPGVFLLGLVPVVGPLLAVAWGGWALSFQMTDPALSRRGMSFADKRRWHRSWRAESLGFGLAGMVGLLVPLANLILGPALVTGGTLLVLDLEDLDAERPQPAPPASSSQLPSL